MGGTGPGTRSEILTEETETCFSRRHGAEDLGVSGPPSCPRSSSGELFEEEDDPEVDARSSVGSLRSVDYIFILAVSCLLTGVSLVALTLPRDVRVDPDSVSAREMERLERERARVGAHLDRCVMAGLSLLTLGGVLLSMLLLSSMWTGRRVLRTDLSPRLSHKFYGSTGLRTSPTHESGSHLSTEEDLELFRTDGHDQD